MGLITIASCAIFACLVLDVSGSFYYYKQPTVILRRPQPQPQPQPKPRPRPQPLPRPQPQKPIIIVNQKYEVEISRMQAQFATLVHRQKKAARRGCDGGTIVASICEKDGDFDDCTHKIDPHAAKKVFNIPVKYTRRFMYAPIVTAGISGIYSEFGKSFAIDVTNVDDDDFNMRIALGGSYPIQLRVNWFACNKRDDDDDDDDNDD